MASIFEGLPQFRNVIGNANQRFTAAFTEGYLIRGSKLSLVAQKCGACCLQVVLQFLLVYSFVFSSKLLPHKSTVLCLTAISK